jgi:RNA polymerase-binding transcription factor DksA
MRLLKERREMLLLRDRLPALRPEQSGFDHDHPAEAARALYDHEEILSTRALLVQRVAEIDAALQRIHDGTYGRCEVCGMPIERERLRVIPTARMRVACQQRHEQELRQQFARRAPDPQLWRSEV